MRALVLQCIIVLRWHLRRSTSLEAIGQVEHIAATWAETEFRKHLKPLADLPASPQQAVPWRLGRLFY